MLRRCVVTAMVVGSALAGRSVPALAVSEGVGWIPNSYAVPTNLSPGGGGHIEIDLVDVGSGDSDGIVTVTDKLPQGVTWSQPSDPQWECEGTSTIVTCTSTTSELLGPSKNRVSPKEEAVLDLPVEVAPGDPEASYRNAVTVSGGGARGVASASNMIAVGRVPAGFGFAGTEAWFTNADGSADTQAGSHPYEFTFDFHLNTEATEAVNGGRNRQVLAGHGEELRNAVVNLPPGVVGDVVGMPQCTRQQFDQTNKNCPASSQVGMDMADLGGFFKLSLPVYNLVPPPGTAAEFGFDVVAHPVFIDVVVRSGGDYGITAHTYDLPQSEIVANRLTLWGVPGEASHDSERCAGEKCGLSFVGVVRPFLTLPTECAGPQEFSALGDSWSNEASYVESGSEWPAGGFTGCNYLGFESALTVSPDTGEADKPAGLTTDLKVPEGGLEEVEGLAPASLKEPVVTLPEGLVLNPGRAAGLQACSPEQAGVGIGEAVGDEGPASCPAASQVGTVVVSTPLLPDKLEGGVYVVQSEPPHLKLLVTVSGDGVNVKTIGEVSLDPVTGRLVTTFPDAPPVPFTEFKLSFSGGPQAALATPTECGEYTTSTAFTAWSAPFVPNVHSESSFAIDSSTGGGSCVSPLPFAPSMIAGATTDQAGGYTNFSLLLSRGDDQQRISKLQFKTPVGLLGMISHVTLCEEPQASKGECPTSSRIGHTVVGAGAGPYPLYVPEPGKPEAPIYITGPYEGAPYGLAIVAPVLAGPFNLGTVVVRGRIEVDPETSQLTITTDPLPTILDGVPVDMRTINAVIDRSQFMFNPTNCNPQTFSGTATSVEGTNAPLSSAFQVGSCRSLAFKPTFEVSTSARTSRTLGASLHVSLSLPDEGGLSSEANVQRVRVSLPKQLPSPLKTLQKACLEKVFDTNPASCPVASQVGQVKVSTPVLPGGLSGAAYFVSHGGAKYPELILVLVGQNGVTVQVHGETFISKQGITTATFATVPDVPFSSFELTLPQREYPALTANGSLCKGTLLMPTEIAAQNGLVIKQSTKIAVAGCASEHVKHKKKAKRVSRRRRVTRSKSKR